MRRYLRERVVFLEVRLVRYGGELSLIDAS